LARLSDVFQSKAQVKLLDYMLANRDRVFNQSSLARLLNLSPSTIARVVEPLIRQRVLLFERYERGMKLLALNEESETTRALLEFYGKLKDL